MLIERLSKQSGLSISKLTKIQESASSRYFVFEIDKRTKGKRTIAHPSRELKSIQRWLNRSFLSKFQIHKNATAYQMGSSIRENALRHLSTNFTVRFDFKDFFPSFEDVGIKLFLQNQSGALGLELSNKDIDFATDIMTRHNVLTIGAPSSPILTNAMMYKFDCDMAEICQSQDLIYTRYADDLFVSSKVPNGLEKIPAELRDVIAAFEYAKLQINEDKTAYLSRKYNRTITGLVITPDGKISVGRRRKKIIKALIHRSLSDDLEPGELGSLSGLISFVYDVENTFYQNLIVKYGQEDLEQLMKCKSPSLKKIDNKKST